MNEIAVALHHKVTEVHYKLFKELILENQCYNFLSGLHYFRIYPNHIIEINFTPDCEIFYNSITSSHDVLSPARELENYQYVPRQILLSSLYHIVETETSYKSEHLHNVIHSQSDVLGTSYYHPDGSISLFSHYIDNRVNAYLYINNVAYILALMNIENKLFFYQEILKQSTYRKTLISPLSVNAIDNEDKYIKLTNTERKIVGLLLRGSYQAKRIAQILKNSPRTVEEHLQNIRDKFDANDKYDLTNKLQSKLLYIV
ncbi:helix-turn-helix transcriptional regulator [Thiotrichales bacterium 19X7-9]|nr:helix-turn-helix transcriptional regulator [Thiotrichales bacterium 19X7-9]